MALFVPTSYQGIKVGFIVLALIGIFLLSSLSKLRWSQETFFACALLATYGILNSLHGALNDAPGALRVLSVMTVWPILYFIFSAMLGQPNAIRLLVASLKIAYIAILAYSFLFLGVETNIIAAELYFDLDQGQILGIYDGRIEYNLYSISSLFFLTPFWFHYTLIKNPENAHIKINWILLILGLVLCILSGRRALQLVMLITPFIVILVQIPILKVKNFNFRKNLFNFRKIILILTGLILGFILLQVMDIRSDALTDNLLEGFNFSDHANISASERGNQFTSLIDAWSNGNLLFGAGNGSHSEYLRSDIMPWAYELTYVYLLFSTGIIGVIFYFSWFGWGLLRIRKALISRPDMSTYISPIITGVIGLGIGAASNPYFNKFDYLWIIMLPHLLAGGINYQNNFINNK